jgi:hypothetical protein
MNRSSKVLPIYQISPAGEDLLNTAAGRRFGTILADPPWQFQNRTGKVAPEHKRLNRYGTMTLDEIKELPVAPISADTAHLYLWVPNALLPEDPQRWRVRRSWCRLLFQECYRVDLIWSAWKECAHAATGAYASELFEQSQERAFPEARRAIRHH